MQDENRICTVRIIATTMDVSMGSPLFSVFERGPGGWRGCSAAAAEIAAWMLSRAQCSAVVDGG